MTNLMHKFLLHSLQSITCTCFEQYLACFFLNCKANARVKLAKTGHGPHSTTLVCICVVRMLLFVLFGCCFVLFNVVIVCKCVLPLGDNPVAVNKYIISSGDQIVLIQHLVSSLSVSDRPVHRCAPDGHLLRVTIPGAVLIQFVLLRMSKILLEPCTCRGL
jgi:hypothetical protein